MADEPELATSRRSRGRAALLAVAVLLLVCGAAAAGVAYGRTSAPGPDFVVTSAPVVEEPAAVESMPIGAPRPSPQPDAGQPEPPPAVLTASPALPDTGTVASGYRMVNAGISGAQVAGVLAQAFGAVGTPVDQDGSWVVGAPGGPQLTVLDDPLFTWTFADASVLASPVTGQQIEPATAIELTSALLGTIGVDVTAVDWQVDRYSGGTTVTAWQLLSGQRTDLAWRVAFDASGSVIEASGFSAGLEEVPGYPVVGARSAVARSRSLPWTIVGPAPVAGPASSASPSAAPLAPLARPGISIPVFDVTVADAALGLAQYWQPDGGMLFLPSYTLTGDDGSRWSLLAVADPYVRLVPQTYPSDAPAGQ